MTETGKIREILQRLKIKLPQPPETVLNLICQLIKDYDKPDEYIIIVSIALLNKYKVHPQDHENYQSIQLYNFLQNQQPYQKRDFVIKLPAVIQHITQLPALFLNDAKRIIQRYHILANYQVDFNAIFSVLSFGNPIKILGFAIVSTLFIIIRSKMQKTEEIDERKVMNVLIKFYFEQIIKTIENKATISELQANIELTLSPHSFVEPSGSSFAEDIQEQAINYLRDALKQVVPHHEPDFGTFFTQVSALVKLLQLLQRLKKRFRFQNSDNVLASIELDLPSTNIIKPRSPRPQNQIICCVVSFFSDGLL